MTVLEADDVGIVPGASLAAVENYTSVEELRSLCRMVGPIGFRAIHHSLLVEAGLKITEIMHFVSGNASSLEKLKEAVSSQLTREQINQAQRISIELLTRN